MMLDACCLTTRVLFHALLCKWEVDQCMVNVGAFIIVFLFVCIRLSCRECTRCSRAARTVYGGRASERTDSCLSGRIWMNKCCERDSNRV